MSMLASNGVFATAGSRLRTYGGEGGSLECRYEFIRCTKVDFPAPAIPIVMITMGFFFSEDALDASAVDAMLIGFPTVPRWRKRSELWQRAGAATSVNFAEKEMITRDSDPSGAQSHSRVTAI